MKLVATNDTRRAIDLLSLKMFSPLFLVVGKEKNELYRKLRNNIDFIDGKLSESLRMNDKHANYIYEDQKFISDRVDDIVILLKMVVNDSLSCNDEKQYAQNKINIIIDINKNRKQNPKEYF